MGFVLLLGLCVYIMLARVVIRLLMRIPREARNKRIVMYLGIFTAILIPIWDVLLLDWKFNQLCETEAGIHVYEKVVLGPEYWKEDGTMKVLESRKLKDAIPKGFEMVNKLEQATSATSGLMRDRDQIKRINGQKILGERIRFLNFGGWLQRGIFGPVGGKSCPEYMEIRIDSFLNAIFKQQK